MFKLIKVIKELLLYRDYKRLIRHEELNSPEWTKRKLRRDWFYRIYTVINLPPEVLLATDLPIESRPSFVMNEIKPTNEYLMSLKLHELLTLSIEPIKNTNNEAYLVVYQFLFRHLSYFWIIRFVIYITVITSILFNLNSIVGYINTYF